MKRKFASHVLAVASSRDGIAVIIAHTSLVKLLLLLLPLQLQAVVVEQVL